MKAILLSFFLGSLFFAGCNHSQGKLSTTMTETDSVSTREIEKDSITNLSDKDDDNLVSYENLEINKMYTDTVLFKEYMNVGDFDRIFVTKKGKNLFPLYDDDDRSLNRGDMAILTWTVDSIWIPEAPNDKWLSPIVTKLKKIKDGKLSLYKKKYPQPISYHYDESIKNKYSKEDFDEIYDLVQYYLANSRQPLVISDVKNQSDSVKIQYSIEEQEREENGLKTIYTIIGLSNYVENHSSIFQWLYLKRNNYGYRDIYEYDLPNDQLILFN